MLPDDKAILIVVLKFGSFLPIPVTVSHANDMIRCWWHAKEGVHNGKGTALIGHAPMSAEDCRKWLNEAAYAANYQYTDGSEEPFAGAAFAWSEVTAMYIKPTTPPEGEEWKYGDK